MLTRSIVIAAAVLCAVGTVSAKASVVETFDWVSTAATAGGTTTPSGILQLTLSTPLTSGSASGTFTSTAATAAAAAAELSGFSFTFSDGEGLTLADLKTAGNSISTDITWATSSNVTPAGAPSGYYLISGFTFSGHKTFAGTSAAGNYQIAETRGLVGNVALDSNNVTPGAGGPAAAVDAGYWQLQPTTVPVPGSLSMLLFGIGGLAALRRGRKSAPA